MIFLLSPRSLIYLYFFIWLLVEPSKITLNYGNYVFDEDENIEELIKENGDNEAMDKDYVVKSQPTKRKKITIITADITAILHRAKISDRMTARVLAATLMKADISLDDVSLSRETIRRNRRVHRTSLNDLIQDHARRRSSHNLCVHWDGK